MVKDEQMSHPSLALTQPIVTATATCSSKYARTAVAEEISGVLVGEQGVSASDAHA